MMITTLPLELQEEIFTYLSVSEILLARATCTYFSLLTENEALWRRIYYLRFGGPFNPCSGWRDWWAQIRKEEELIETCRVTAEAINGSDSIGTGRWRCANNNEEEELLEKMGKTFRKRCIYLEKEIHELFPISDDENIFFKFIWACDQGHHALVKHILRDDIWTIEKLMDIGKKYINTVKHDLPHWINDRTLRVLRVQDTPLHTAARHGFYHLAKYLIDEIGIDVCIKRYPGVTPMLLAAQEGNCDITKLLLDRNAEIDANRDDGTTALLRSSQNGHEELVRLLIERKADLNAANIESSTPIFLAAQNGHHTIVKLLLENNTNVNVLTNDRVTPLFMAAQAGDNDMIKILLEYKADINFASMGDQITPLFVASEHNMSSTVKYLIEENAEIGCIAIDGTSPLFGASARKYKDIIKLLIEAEANINITAIDGSTALIWAMQDDNEEVVDILLSNRADPNIICSDGSTALSTAVRLGHTTLVKKLLEYNAIVTNEIFDLSLSVTSEDNSQEIILSALLETRSNTNREEEEEEEEEEEGEI